MSSYDFCSLLFLSGAGRQAWRDATTPGLLDEGPAGEDLLSSSEASAHSSLVWSAPRHSEHE